MCRYNTLQRKHLWRSGIHGSHTTHVFGLYELYLTVHSVVDQVPMAEWPQAGIAALGPFLTHTEMYSKLIECRLPRSATRIMRFSVVSTWDLARA
ncbi:hypothetical protein M378DRAFT_336349 [Amanita muscaria Koide BX008]|uniref:Uncharacterized protein n=1 Tax=Amanita muscaria (strain Koide BX008) TaxID=946122 RepID=A0A0C2WNG5_AMAMK|nr:hypothetical protein M378DRAFT_336349 [Amanita muscaria Koide BX008]